MNRHPVLFGHLPVMAILHDHFDVPSSTACSAMFIRSKWVSAFTSNVVLDFVEGRKEKHRVERKNGGDIEKDEQIWSVTWGLVKSVLSIVVNASHSGG